MVTRGRAASQTVFFICLIVLVTGLCLYSHAQPGLLEPKAAAEAGQDAIGREVQVCFYGRVKALGSDSFEIEQLQESFRVIGRPDDLAPGDRIHVRGTWLGDRTIHGEQWHSSKQRAWRVWVSIPPMLLGLWLLFTTFCWNWRRWRFEIRDTGGAMRDTG